MNVFIFWGLLMKICSQCKIEKDESEFYISDRLTSGLCSYCKKCSAEFRKKYQKSNKEKVNAASKKWREDNKEKVKLQNKIRRDKNKDKINERERIKHKERMLDPEYAKRQRDSERLRLSNPEKKKAKLEYSKIHWQKNKERHSQRRKEILLNIKNDKNEYEKFLEKKRIENRRLWAESQGRNPEDIKLNKELKKALSFFNKEFKHLYTSSISMDKVVTKKLYLLKQSIITKKRRLEDPQFRLADNLRSRMRKGLREQSANKLSGTAKLSGMSMNDTCNYLISMGYNLETDQIDHIIPLSRFNLIKKEHQLVACHYLNLQPLHWKKNYSKHNSLVDNWQDKIIEICNVRNIDPKPIIQYIQADAEC